MKQPDRLALLGACILIALLWWAFPLGQLDSGEDGTHHAISPQLPASSFIPEALTRDNLPDGEADGEGEQEGWIQVKLIAPAAAGSGLPIPLAGRDLQVISKGKIISSDGTPCFSAQSGFSTVPVNGEGVVTFRFDGGEDSQEIGVVGTGLVSHEDLLVESGFSYSIPLYFAYGVDLHFRAEDTEGPIVRDVDWTRKATVFMRRDPSHQGLKSHLASSYLSWRLPDLPSTASFHRILAYSENEYQDGISLDLNVNNPGYASKRVSTHIPFLAFPLHPEVVSLQRAPGETTNLVLGVDRAGDWSPYENYEYRSQARVWIGDEEGPRYPLYVPGIDLRPGSRTLRQVPISDPALVVEWSAPSRLYPHIPEARSRLPYLDEVSLESGEVARRFRLDASQACAIVIPPGEGDFRGRAWVGAVHHDHQGVFFSIRYEASSGIIVDGLLPGAYDIFLGQEREAFMELMDSGVPTAHLRVLPGVNIVEGG